MRRSWFFLLMITAMLLAPLLQSPSVRAAPDSCEPNDDFTEACTLTLGVESAENTIDPAGDQDFFVVDVGEASAGPVQITINATDGLDLVVVSYNSGRTQLGRFSPPDTLEIDGSVSGNIFLQVEDRTGGVVAGENYTVLVERLDPPPAGQLPDACEPNESPQQACRVALNTVSQLLTLIPLEDVDYLVVDVGDDTTRTPIVNIWTESGLQFVASIQSRETGETLGRIESPDTTIELDPSVTGDILIQVQSRSLTDDIENRAYRLEVRRDTVAPTSTPTATATPTMEPNAAREPDDCEPNESFAEACRLNGNSVSDLLTLWPPDEDRDFFIVDVGAEDEDRPPEVAVWPSSDLTVVVTVYDSNRDVIGTIRSPDETVLLDNDVEGDIFIQVESRDVELNEDESTGYRLETRRIEQQEEDATAETEEEPTATPGQSERPDYCEPNNSFDEACDIPLNTVSGILTFLGEGDVDVFRSDTGQSTGIPVSVNIWASGGLDLHTTVYDADTFEVLSVMETPTISTTLSADLTGPIFIHVENRSLEETTGESYRLEVRRTPLSDGGGNEPPPPDDEGAPDPSVPGPNEPDMLENNWSEEVAVPIATDYIYRLNFVCPVPGACEGGDHDWLKTPVQADIEYLIATFDLDPGADTVLDLFMYDSTGSLVRIAHGDDLNPLSSALTAFEFTPPVDGMLFIRIGPRNGAYTSRPDVTNGYSFLIARVNTPIADEVRAILAEQARTASPTPTSTATEESSVEPTDDSTGPGGPPQQPPPPPPPAMPSVTGVISVTETPISPPARVVAPEGMARVITDTRLYAAPDTNAEWIYDVPANAYIHLVGESSLSGTWVMVELDEGVIPGWIDASLLRRVEGTPTPTVQATVNPLDATATAASVAADAAAAGGSPTPVPLSADIAVDTLEPIPRPPQPSPIPDMPLEVQVTVIGDDASSVEPEPGMPVPTPNPDGTLAGVRVQLVNIFGDVLTEAVTPASGEVTLNRDLTPGMRVYVRLPAPGIQVEVNPEEPEMIIVLPGGTS